VNGWAVGWSGEIFVTTNGGNSWDLQYKNGHSQFVDVAFTDLNTGWAVASHFNDTIWMTTNGGTTWQTNVLPYKTFWRGVSFHSPDTGWVSGGSAGFGIILRTNNGGQSWELDHNSPEALLGIEALPHEETVWSVGLGGNIVKYSPCVIAPMIEALSGLSQPCARDTVTYSIESIEVDVFEWTFPPGWLVLGNPNTSSVDVIVGLMNGVISVKGTDACNNETQTLMMNVAPIPVPPAEITFDQVMLMCDLTGGTYQWLLNGSPVSGAITQFIIPLESGVYECVVTMNSSGCETRSNALSVIISSTDQPEKNDITLWPNPANDRIYIGGKITSAINEPSIIRIWSSTGQMHIGRRVGSALEVSHLTPGMYVLIMPSADTYYSARFIIMR
jgi:hypothetical protein